jgi:prepilin-type N-terminal cleavage/methylation domain-containing protein
MSILNRGQTVLYNMKQKSIQQHGFTLVELLVSLAIFSMVVIASLGAMLSIADANRRVQKTRAVLDNLSLSIESMSRNLRLGSAYHCETMAPPAIPSINLHTPQECSSNFGDFISFEDQFGDQTNNADQAYYYLDSDPASATKGSLMYRKYGTSTAPIALTSDDLTIRALRFYVTGITGVGEKTQPKVIIVVSGTTEVGKAKEPVEINIQTTVSQRPLNI